MSRTARAVSVLLVAVLVSAPLDSSLGRDSAEKNCPDKSKKLKTKDVQGANAVDCGLVGIAVENESGNLSVQIPEAGGSVGLSVEYAVDVNLPSELTIKVDTDGIISSSDADPLESGSSASARVARRRADDPCVQTAYALNGGWWPDVVNWSINRGSIDANDLNRDNAVQAVRDGLQSITGASGCGINDNVFASGNYLGDTNANVAIGAIYDGTTWDINCANGWDDKNTVMWKNMGNAGSGATCWRNIPDSGTPSDRRESDMIFNLNAAYPWTTTGGSSSCSGEYDLQSTATHEFGHWFGLADLQPGSGGNKQTMWYTSFGTCNIEKRSLGKGDIQGLAYLY